MLSGLTTNPRETVSLGTEVAKLVNSIGFARRSTPIVFVVWRNNLLVSTGKQHGRTDTKGKRLEILQLK